MRASPVDMMPWSRSTITLEPSPTRCWPPFPRAPPRPKGSRRSRSPDASTVGVTHGFGAPAPLSAARAMTSALILAARYSNRSVTAILSTFTQSPSGILQSPTSPQPQESLSGSRLLPKGAESPNSATTHSDPPGALLSGASPLKIGVGGSAASVPAKLNITAAEAATPAAAPGTGTAVFRPSLCVCYAITMPRRWKASGCPSQSKPS